MLSLFLSATPPPSDSWWYGPLVPPTAAGISVTNDVALTYSAVWACTRVLSASGSCLPLNLMRRNGKATEVAGEHRVHKLIHGLPNVEMGSMGMRSLGIIQQVNAGNFYAEITRDMLGQVAALWPLNPDRVKPARADADLAIKLGIPVNGLCWRVTRDSGEYDWLPDRDMFHVRSIITDNGIIGKGVIQNARETIAHGIATVQQGAAYMKNSARPSVVISGGRFKNAEDQESYRRMWADVHGGPANNAKPAMLPQDADIKVLSFSPEDSQFIQTLQHSVEEISRWYGVPPHMIQHLLRSTFSNIEHQGIDFVVYSLVPWLKMWEEEVFRKLLTEEERLTYYAKHNVEGLLRGDSAARAAFYQALWQLGAFSINEIRELEDLNPIEGGDEHFVQTSYTTLARAIEGEPEPQTQPQPAKGGDKEKGELASAVNDLIEYQQPPAISDADRRIAAVQDAARLMVEEVAERLLTKEIKALERAASKQPAAFFGWLDEFYGEHESHLSDALRRPVQAYAIAAGEVGDMTDVVRQLASAQIKAAKDAVLSVTECQPEEWAQLGQRLAVVNNEWRASRVPALVEHIRGRVSA